MGIILTFLPIYDLIACTVKVCSFALSLWRIGRGEKLVGIKKVSTALSTANLQKGENSILFKLADKLAKRVYDFSIWTSNLHIKALLYLINKKVPWYLKLAYLISIPLTLLLYNLLPPEMIIDNALGPLDDLIVTSAVTSRFNRSVEKGKYLPEEETKKLPPSEDPPNEEEALDE